MGAPTISTQPNLKYGFPKYDSSAKVLEYIYKDVDIVVDDPGGTEMQYAIGDGEWQTLATDGTSATISLKDTEIGTETTVKVRGVENGTNGAELTFTARRVRPFDAPAFLLGDNQEYDEATSTISYDSEDITLSVMAPINATKVLYTTKEDADPAIYGQEAENVDGWLQIKITGTVPTQKTVLRMVGTDGELFGKEQKLNLYRVAPIAPPEAPALIGYINGSSSLLIPADNSTEVVFTGSAALKFNYPEGTTMYRTIAPEDVTMDESMLKMLLGNDNCKIEPTVINGASYFVITAAELLGEDDPGATPMTAADFYFAAKNKAGVGEITKIKVRIAKPEAPALTGYLNGVSTTPIEATNTSEVVFTGSAALALTYEPGAEILYCFGNGTPSAKLTAGNDGRFTITATDMLSALGGATEGTVSIAAKNAAGMGPVTTIRVRIAAPEAPAIEVTSGYFGDTRGDITFINNSLVLTAKAAASGDIIQYQMAKSANGNWPETPAENDWTDLTSADGAISGTGIFATGRFFVRAARKAAESSSVMLYSNYVYRDLNRLEALPLSLSSKDNWQCDENELIQLTDRVKITGYYKTNAPGNPDYVYLQSENGKVIKLVGKNLPQSFANLMADPAKTYCLPANGITGRLKYNGAKEFTEIYLFSATEDFTSLLAIPAAVTDFPESPVDAGRTSINGADDFNRYVELRSLTWLGSKNEVRLKDGTVLPVYTRLDAADFEPGSLNSLIEGKMYRVRGFIGFADNGLAIFPVKPIEQCPGTPALFAPNPIGEPDASGVVAIQAISPQVTFTVKGNDLEDNTSFKYSLDNGSLLDVADSRIVIDLSGKANNSITTLRVYGYLNGMTSLSPAVVTITKKDASPVASIHDFKKDIFDNGMNANIYQMGGEAIIEEITEKYLYVRDYSADESADDAGAIDPDGYLRRLLIFNDKGWLANVATETGERPLAKGDIITGFALVPTEKNGNIFSSSTGFARTFRCVGSEPGKVSKPEDRAVNSLDGTTFEFVDTDRMRLVTLKDVTVTKSNNPNPTGDSDNYIYTLDLAPGKGAQMRFDIFTFRGGWAEAHQNGLPFDITGVVLRTATDGVYSLAPISFKGKEKLDAPMVYLSTADEGSRGELEQPFTSGSIIMAAAENAPAGTTIHYSIDGLDPLNNLGSRIKYTGEIALGDNTVEVRAFAAAPGYTPSDVVVRRFTKNSKDVQFILNFLTTAEKNRNYRFTCDTRVVAVGTEYMFVVGRVGHYLPIRLSEGWDGKNITPGQMLTGFTVGYDVDPNGNRMAVADGFESTFTPTEAGEDETLAPVADEATALNADLHARRLVHLTGVRINSATTARSAATWTVTEGGDNGAVHALNTSMLVNAPIYERDPEGNITATLTDFADGDSYDITGFVMLTDAADGMSGMEIWPTEATHLRRTSGVKATYTEDGVELSSDTGSDGAHVVVFKKHAIVTLACDTKNSTILYALGEDADNLVWYTYQRPFAVTAGEYIHAKAIAPNSIESEHTHIVLSVEQVQVAQSVDISVDNSIAGKATVTMTAGDNATIKYWTSSDTESSDFKEKTYTGPFAITKTDVVYAYAVEEDKVNSEVTHRFVVVEPVADETPEKPETPADKISGKVKFSVEENEDHTAMIVTIRPDGDMTGTIYYLINPTGEETEWLKYEAPITMTEGGRIMAYLVESGKLPGEPTDVTVWLIPTDIDSIDADRKESEVRAEGADIIAPAGSEVYDITGRRVNPTGLRAGIYIVRTPDGKSVKVRI